MSEIVLSTFWTGRTSPYERLCLTSWLAQGFPVEVYTLDEGIDLPAGAIRRDAREIFQTDRVWRYEHGPRIGSAALHSNLMRYRLLEQGKWWLDTDVVLLNDTIPTGDFFLGWESSHTIGTAVMRLPPGSKLLRKTTKLADAGAPTAKWGDIGPNLVTRLVRELGLMGQVSDMHIAYPIHFSKAGQMFDPAAREEVEQATREATFLHLWNSTLREFGLPEFLGPPAGSYLDALFQRFGLADVFTIRMPADCAKRWWNMGMANKILKGRILKLEADFEKATEQVQAARQSFENCQDTMQELRAEKTRLQDALKRVTAERNNLVSRLGAPAT